MVRGVAKLINKDNADFVEKVQLLIDAYGTDFPI